MSYIGRDENEEIKIEDDMKKFTIIVSVFENSNK